MANEIQGLDTAGIIRDLKKRRAELDATIAGLERVYGATPWNPEDGGIADNGIDFQPTELPRGAFLGKSLPAAIKLFLQAIKRKQTIREIAMALREGGVESTSDNFESVVTGCLNRMKSNGEVLRFKDGWGLTEFYPEHLRRSLSQEGASKGKNSKKKKKKAKKNSQQAAKSKKSKSDNSQEPSPAPSAGSPKSGLEQRIEEFARSRVGHSFSAADLLHAYPDIEPKSLPMILGRLAKKHLWIKEPSGKYRYPE